MAFLSKSIRLFVSQGYKSSSISIVAVFYFIWLKQESFIYFGNTCAFKSSLYIQFYLNLNPSQRTDSTKNFFRISIFYQLFITCYIVQVIGILCRCFFIKSNSQKFRKCNNVKIINSQTRSFLVLHHSFEIHINFF